MSDTLLKVVQGVVADAGNVLIPKSETGADASLRAILDERDRLRKALDATYDDVMVLLDHHVSHEVEMEARYRLIERMQAANSHSEPQP